MTMHKLTIEVEYEDDDQLLAAVNDIAGLCETGSLRSGGGDLSMARKNRYVVDVCHK